MTDAAISEILSRLDWIETALSEGVCQGHSGINTAFTHVYTMANGRCSHCGKIQRPSRLLPIATLTTGDA